jgi:hypothetical protein
VANITPLGCALLLPIDTVNCVATLKAVNGVGCEDESHENVVDLIKATEGRKDLELMVVSDPSMKLTATTATSGLLKKKAKEVISENTGIPHFTVEMTQKSLGRTAMLQRKIFGTPAPANGQGTKLEGVQMVKMPPLLSSPGLIRGSIEADVLLTNEERDAIKGRTSVSPDPDGGIAV